MKKSMILLLVGVILIILAIVVLGLFYMQGMKNSEIANVQPNSSKNIYFNLTDDKNYTIYLNSHSNISYEFYAPNGTLLYKKDNITTGIINITYANGSYQLVLKNRGNSTVEVIYIVSKENAMKKSLYGIYASGGMCCLGFVIVVIALILLLWNRKIEERQYRRRY